MVRERIEKIVNSIYKCMGGAKTDYLIYDGNEYRYRIYYDGEHTINPDRLNNVFICYLRIDYKYHGEKLYRTFGRVIVKNEGLNYKDNIDAVYTELKEIVLNSDDLNVYKDFFV